VLNRGFAPPTGIGYEGSCHRDYRGILRQADSRSSGFWDLPIRSRSADQRGRLEVTALPRSLWQWTEAGMGKNCVFHAGHGTNEGRARSTT